MKKDLNVFFNPKSPSLVSHRHALFVSGVVKKHWIFLETMLLEDSDKWLLDHLFNAHFPVNNGLETNTKLLAEMPGVYHGRSESTPWVLTHDFQHAILL